VHRSRRSHLWSLTVLAATVAALLLAACGSASDQASSPGPSASSWTGPTATVAIVDWKFTPRKLVVLEGTMVIWTNTDVVEHDVVSTDGPSTTAATTDLFSSGRLGTGQSFSHVFDEAGTYYYECTSHAAVSAMHGTVDVQ
jgi:plastocyanin